MKRTEYLFKLAKFTITLTAVSVTAIALIWVVVHNDVSTMDAIINFKDATIELSCEFAK